MKNMRAFGISLIFVLSAFVAKAESSYSIAEYYSVVEAKRGTKAVGKSNKVIDAEYILVPTKVDKGKFIAKVKKIGTNLYLIKDTDICVETRSCYEWTSSPEEVVLIFESNYGYTKGKIIFD